MREIRTSGSEGGEAELNRPSLPLSNYSSNPGAKPRRMVFSLQLHGGQPLTLKHIILSPLNRLSSIGGEFKSRFCAYQQAVC